METAVESQTVTLGADRSQAKTSNLLGFFGQNESSGAAIFQNRFQALPRLLSFTA
jgi:hypothetical protein